MFTDTRRPVPGGYRAGDTYLQVSYAARAERRRNWREIPDVGAGWAIVKHSDWSDLYSHLCARNPDRCTNWPNPDRFGPAFYVSVCTPDQSICHVGSIALTNGQLSLDG